MDISHGYTTVSLDHKEKVQLIKELSVLLALVDDVADFPHAVKFHESLRD